MKISLNDAYSLQTPSDNRELYAKWASTYESDFVKGEGYEHPRVVSEIFDTYVPTVETVVDIGAGTGLVGFNLKNLRQSLEIDGIDISPEMLAEAKKKKVYRNLYLKDLTKSIDETLAPYDALICIGVFTHGHLPMKTISNLLELVKPKGHFVIGINAKYFTEENFEKYFGELFESQIISLPKYLEVQVYADKSPHRDSTNIVAIFNKF